MLLSYRKKTIINQMYPDNLQEMLCFMLPLNDVFQLTIPIVSPLFS